MKEAKSPYPSNRPSQLLKKGKRSRIVSTMTIRDTVISMKKMSSAAVKAIAPLNVVRKRERNPSILKGPSTAVRFPAVSVRPAGKHRLLLRISSAVS